MKFLLLVMLVIGFVVGKHVFGASKNFNEIFNDPSNVLSRCCRDSSIMYQAGVFMTRLMY